MLNPLSSIILDTRWFPHMGRGRRSDSEKVVVQLCLAENRRQFIHKPNKQLAYDQTIKLLVTGWNRIFSDKTTMLYTLCRRLSRTTTDGSIVSLENTLLCKQGTFENTNYKLQPATNQFRLVKAHISRHGRRVIPLSLHLNE